MPLIQVTAPQGALNKKNQDTLMSQLSDAVLRSEGADPNDPAAQALAWAYYSEGSVGTSYVGGGIWKSHNYLSAPTLAPINQ